MEGVSHSQTKIHIPLNVRNSSMNTPLSEVLQVDLLTKCNQKQMTAEEKSIAENDLKWFHTTNKSQVGKKHVDLLAADNRRR